MSWMFVHLPHFALDVRSRALPQAQPLALIEPGGNEILLLNPMAASMGIQPGMSISTAYSLLPELQLIHRNPQLEQHSLLDLAQLLYSYAAQISIKPPQGLLLEIGSMLRLHGGLERLWQQVENSIQQQGFLTCIAAAHTPLVAQLLAQAGGVPATLNPNLLADHLARLPAAQAGLPEFAAERLQRMGIHQLGQLLELPAAEVGKRFGQDLLRHLARLRGQLADPQSFFTPPDVFVRRLEFIEEIENVHALLFPLQRLLRELGTFLQLRQQVTQRLVLEIGHRSRRDTQLDVRSVQPEYRADEWLHLCRLQLERIQLYAPALTFCLRVEELLPLQAESEDLFHQQHSQQLSRQQLLGRLQARMGSERILGLTTQPDHRPELSAAWIEPGQPRGSLVSTGFRPLWLLPQPHSTQGTALQILRGPERIQSGWWDSEPQHQVCRDYFIARTDTGSLCWAFRTAQGHWFIHGWFA